MIDPRLIQVASDPVRLQVLTLLNDIPIASTNEIARTLGIDPSVAARHLEHLREADLVEVVDEADGGSASEPHFRALARTLWDDEEWAMLGLEERKRLTRWIVEMIDSDAREAVDSGTFTARENSHASRAVAMLDEQGWEEVCRLHEDTLEAVFAVEAACAERLAERGEPGFPIMSAALCCELPPRGSAAAAAD